MSKLKLGIIGTGFLGTIVAQAHADGFLPEYELVGVLGRTEEKTRMFADTYKCVGCTHIDDFLNLNLDYVAEAASVQSVIDYTEMILNQGSHIAVLSIGAFANKSFYDHITEVAQKANRKVYIASGAVGGFDVLRTATLMSAVSVSMTGKKSPQSLVKTSLYRDGLLEISDEEVVFSGTTKEAIAALPTHVNVSIAVALASAGPENVNLEIKAIPGYVGDEHRIILEGDEVKTDLKIYSKTSAIAGWSLVSTLQNAIAPIVF